MITASHYSTPIAPGAPDTRAATARLAREAATSVGARGVLALPCLASERNPICNPVARGDLAGLTPSHTRRLFRALYEAIGFGARHIVDTFGDGAAAMRRVVAVVLLSGAHRGLVRPSRRRLAGPVADRAG